MIEGNGSTLPGHVFASTRLTADHQGWPIGQTREMKSTSPDGTDSLFPTLGMTT